MAYSNTLPRNNQPPFPEKIDLDELARAIINDVAYELMPDRVSHETDREIRFGNRGSFSVNKRLGTFYDHEQQIGGGLLDMICHLRNFEQKRQAVHWLEKKGFIDGTFTPSQRPRPQVQPRPQATGDMFKVGLKLWKESVSIPFYQNHPVRCWCRHRNLFPAYRELPSSIRFHKKYKGGCIIVALAPISDFVHAYPADPEPKQFHLIAIDKQGRKGNAFNGDDKRTYGQSQKPCVALFGDPNLDEIAICEGIADALAILSDPNAPDTATATVTTFQKLIRCNTSMSHLASRAVTIFADNDEAGHKAQDAIGNALYERGGDVFVHENLTAKDPAEAAEVQS